MAGPPQASAQQGTARLALSDAAADLPAAGRKQALDKVAPQEARAAGHQAALRAHRAPPRGHHAVPSEAGWQGAARQGWLQQTQEKRLFAHLLCLLWVIRSCISSALGGRGPSGG